MPPDAAAVENGLTLFAVDGVENGLMPADEDAVEKGLTLLVVEVPEGAENGLAPFVVEGEEEKGS